MSSQHLRRVLQITLYVLLYSIVCLMVLFLGSLLRITLPYQIVLVVLILLTLPFAMAVNHYRNRQTASKAANRPAKSGKSASVSAPVRVYDELTRGAEEVVQWLRSTKLAASKSGDAIYKLPWFLVAGSAKSGKTSLLLSAELDFQALPSQRQTDLNLIRPTPDLVWRVTNSTINIDTAGRYQSEDADGDECSSLIETVKKHRRERPLDGFVVAVDAARVFTCKDTEVEQKAKILRARLDEVIQRTQVRFPVYLV